MDRRDFLKIVGVGSGTLLASSCSKKEPTHLIPYVVPPEDGLLPGKSLAVRSTCAECPAGCGVTAMAREKTVGVEKKRYVIKLEGTAGHPVNDGALCSRGQTALTRLYHSARIKSPMARQTDGTFAPVAWSDAETKITAALANNKTSGKENVFLSGRTDGSLANLIDDFCQKTGVTRLPEFELYSHAAIRKANEIVFGRNAVPSYAVDQADLLVTVGADILDTFVSPIRFTKQLTRARASGHFHWFHVEPGITLTGLRADDRVVALPGSESHLIAWLLHEVRHAKPGKLSDEVVKAIPQPTIEATATATGIGAETLRKIAHAIAESHHPLVIAGGASTNHRKGLDVAVLTALLQKDRGMDESTIDFDAVVNDKRTGTLADVGAFAAKLETGAVGVAILSRTDVAGLLAIPLNKAAFRVGLGDTMTATMKQCDIVLPLSHALESWDVREPVKGMLTLSRPAMDPLYDTKSEGDILIRLMDEQSTWRQYLQVFHGNAFAALEKSGTVVVPPTKTPVSLNEPSATSFVKGMLWESPSREPALLLTPSVRTYDGRGGDVALAREIPDPLTTVSYGNAVVLSRSRAEQWGMKNGDEVKVSPIASTATVMILPSLSDNIVMLARDSVGGPMRLAGNDAGDEVSVVEKVALEKTGKRVAMPILSGILALDKPYEPKQGHHDDHGEKRPGNGMYPEHDHKDYLWGMAVNLDACTGCSACVAACYIENNVPVTGAVEHVKGRELSWIRIEPNIDKEGTTFMPMLCQQCENAPCEPVCPALATYHNPDGLNAQVYNRCVGTRYCSNNCPYKARRFNWFDYAWDGDLRLMLNPDVSTRSRGIMEKCTFCVQRIRAGKDAAKDEDRKVRDGEIVPACAQTCPADAIVFGNLLDPASRVSRAVASDAASLHLEEMGTRPKVYYLRSVSSGGEHGDLLHGK